MDLLDLMVKVSVDDQTDKGIGSVSDSLKGKLATAAKAGAAALAAVTTAATAVAGSIVSATKQVAEYGDNIDKMSQKMGISAKAYQEWDAVLQHSGTSIDAMQRGMITLQKEAVDNADAFAQLGISQEQLASMSTEDLFAATIEGLQNMEEGAERTKLASELLGMSAKELGPLLNTSAEETQAMKDRVNELGGVMSDEAVKAAAAFQDSLQDWNTALQGFQNNLTAEFLPGVTSVFDGLQELLVGDSEKGAELVGEGVEQILAKLEEVMPKLMEIVGQVFETIAPVLMQAIGELAANIVVWIVTHIPDILMAAATLFMALVEGLDSVITPLLQEVGRAIGDAINAIREFLGQMLESGKELFGKVIEGLASRAGELVERAREGIQGAIDAIGRFFSDMYSAGSNLVSGLVNGIADNIWQVLNTITGGLQDAVDSALSFLGISSPSKLFAWVGEMSMEGLAEGIEQGAAKAEKAMLEATQGLEGLASGKYSFDGNIAPQMALESPQSGNGGDVYNIYVRDGSEDVAVRIRNELHAYNLTRGR